MVRRRKKEKKFRLYMKKKLVAVMFVVIALLIFLLFNVFRIIQEKEGTYTRSKLAQHVQRVNNVNTVLLYRRGDIVDRNGSQLAISVKVYDLILSPLDIIEGKENGEFTIKKVAELYGLDEGKLRTDIYERPKSQYMKVTEVTDQSSEQRDTFDKIKEEAKKAREDAAEKADKEDDEEAKEHLPPVIVGAWFEEKYVRRYPMGTVACNVVGFADGEQGTLGIEGYYNSFLCGRDGKAYGYFDSDLELQRKLIPAVNGNTVVSSIDSNVQRIIEEKIAEYKKEPGAENVAVMVMDPNNGEVLAMATDTLFDLNDPRDLSAYYTEQEVNAMSNAEQAKALNNIWRNFCISDTYEPGSTFKPFTVAAALDEGTTNANIVYDCAGKIQVSDYEIGCANRVSHGAVTPKKALMESCNVALMNIAAGLGRTQFHKYIGLFGFGRTTGIDLANEERGIIHTEEELNSVELATSSFGQTQNVTMIQMLSAFCSLINGGNYYQPHVVKKIVNEQGGIVAKMDGRILRQTVTAGTSEFIRDALAATVEEGTATDANVAGYQIAGKTGTAEKRPVEEKNYIVSFMGFAPADKPQIAIYVLIDQPNVEDQAHSSYATQFASKIMKDILPFLGIYPDKEAKE
ncbi:MAG: penicillin-binding protein 2 [Lachnospiraceae bacterium]|nr:penicillin-binding protein 2 [Lachnospiraceae bacterium]